jgi:hypothetical protein
MKKLLFLLLLFSVSVSAKDIFFTQDQASSDFEFNARCWAYSQISGEPKSVVDYYRKKINQETYTEYQEGLNVGYASGFVKSGSVLLEISKTEAAKIIFNSTCKK